MQKAVMLFGQKVEPGGSYDLMTIPYISESDIQHSLLKGTLRNKLSIGEIRVTESNINLVQYSAEFTEFLQSVGVSSGISSDGATGVDNCAALSQVNDTAVTNGTAISVVTVSDIYILDNTSTATVDGIVIVATKSGTGRWVRSGISSPKWAIRDTWYINSIGGDDENVGDTNTTALATFSEYNRRIGAQVVRVLSTVYILNDINETDSMLQGSFSSYSYIRGVPATIATGTITAITQWEHDPSDGYVSNGVITDSNLSGDWSVAGPGGTSLLEKKIVIIDGAAAGAYAYLIEDTGTPKEVHVSPWVSDGGYSEVNPLVDSAYKVVTLPRFTDHFKVFPGNNLILVDLQFESVDPYYPPLETQAVMSALGCIFAGDPADANLPIFGLGRSVFCYNCLFTTGVDVYSTSMSFYGGALKNRAFGHISSSTLQIQGPLVLYNTTGPMDLIVRDGSYINVLTGASIGVVVIGSNTDGRVLQIRDTSSALIAGVLYSIGGSTGNGVWMSSGSTVLWTPVSANANTKFLFASADDFSIGEVVKTIAELSTTGYFNPANGARVVPSS